MSARAAGSSRCGLRLLSIDGGGIRGLSSLLILREVLYRMQQQQGLAEIPRPCDVFDLAGGTGTGGIIVLMLFRLKMTIEDAIRAYVDLSIYVSAEKRRWPLEDSIFHSNRLETAIVSIIQSASNVKQPRELRMLNKGGPKCFVCALPTRNMIFPTLFRSFSSTADPIYNCTVLEAAMATSADISIFEEAKISYLGLQETFVGGSMGTNNPALYVLHEAKSTFPNQDISCLLSLGTGTKGVIGMGRPSDPTTMRLIDVLGRIAMDCEATSENTARYLSKTEVTYFRLSIEQGEQRTRLTEWEKLPVVQTHTDQYLTQYDVVRKVDHLVRILISSVVPATPKATSTPPATGLSAAGQQAFEELKASVSINACHESQARSTSLGCLPSTRKDQIGTIMNWIESQASNRKPLFVILGPAGSGKSCLLWTVARICKDKGSYAAGFFFSATDPERNTSDRLVNTIVYQICEAIPELRPYVARVVETEASILSGSLYARLYSLLLQPLRQLQSDHPGISFRPRIVIIDAVDACSNENDQTQVIATLTEALSSGSFPFLCILSSRFGRHIEGVLSADPLIHIGVTLGLAGTKEMQDIRSYVDHEMKVIRSRHPSVSRIHDKWPSESDLQTIIRRSGGQFIYAEVVMRYIGSPDHNPQDRLQDIVASETGTNAFDALDDLYRALMFSIKNIESAMEILGPEILRLSPRFWTPEGLAYHNFVKDHFVKLDADLVLAPLAPVLKYEDQSIKFYHLSFSEFLLDPARSREYFVHPTKWQKWSVSRLVQLFYNEGTHAGDVDYLIKEAKPGTELHQSINAGLELVIDHPKRLPSGGNFNIWPLVTEAFFWRLRFGIWVEKIATVFLQQGKDFLPLPVLIKLAPTHKLSNSFLLFELCRTLAGLKVAGFIKESDKDWQPDPDGLFRCMAYLADFFDDQHCPVRNVLMPEDYHSAILRCLWYLQTPRRGIHSSLREELCSLKYLPPRLGIPKYLRDSSNNITRGVLEVLFSLLPQSPSSVDLLATLNTPFDAEVISMNPALSRKARNVIHEYLKRHDSDYQGELLEEAENAEEDEPLPHFKWFLKQDNEQ